MIHELQSAIRLAHELEMKHDRPYYVIKVPVGDKIKYQIATQWPYPPLEWWDSEGIRHG